MRYSVAMALRFEPLDSLWPAPVAAGEDEDTPGGGGQDQLGVATKDPTTPKQTHPFAGGEDEDTPGGGGQDQLGVATKTRTKPKKPSQFKVLMLNDDYTPM